jgi:3-dehydroquinate dehydratase/shikimate dehydrogenase
MICISINQESRRMALVDMYNSAKQCDLLEVRLDRFGMAPELNEILARKPTPVIMSCRRPQDGGHWDGSEAERLALLRQCITSKADYVEIELDVADQVRKLPPTRRVISYTVRPTDSAQDIQDRYAEAQTKEPDVIKLTTLARTPEEAWPLVQILAKPPVPTVVVGLGKPGVMLTILGRKIGAPWTYAALEKGMEAYPGQPTVHELRTIYHYDQVSRGTRLIGVTGFDQREYGTVAGLNAALAHLELPARCLPLAVGSARLFRKIIDAVKLASVVVDGAHQEMLLEIASQKHPSAEFAGLVDVLLQKGDSWTGYFTFPQAALAALTESLTKHGGGEDPLPKRMVLIVGLGPVARSLAADLTHRKTAVILASRKRKAVQEAAHELGCRHVGFEAIPTTMHDTLIVCDEEKDENARGKLEGLHPGSLKPGSTVMDLTTSLTMSALLREALQRGCRIVAPREVLLSQLDLQTRLITGKQLPPEVFAQAVPQTEEE